MKDKDIILFEKILNKIMPRFFSWCKSFQITNLNLSSGYQGHNLIIRGNILIDNEWAKESWNEAWYEIPFSSRHKIKDILSIEYVFPDSEIELDFESKIAELFLLTFGEKISFVNLSYLYVEVED